MSLAQQEFLIPVLKTRFQKKFASDQINSLSIFKSLAISTDDPCENVTCPFYGVCNVMANKAVCSCVTGCPFILSQVCGSDSVTYDNECLLKIASCKSKKHIAVKHKGACGECQEYRQLFILRGVPKIVLCLCCCCGGAVNSIILVSSQFHRSGFKLEFETLFESI